MGRGTFPESLNSLAYNRSRKFTRFIRVYTNSDGSIFYVNYLSAILGLDIVLFSTYTEAKIANSTLKIARIVFDRLRVGGTTRADDAQGTPTQSHISPSIPVYEDQIKRVSESNGREMLADFRTGNGEITPVPPPSSSLLFFSWPTRVRSAVSNGSKIIWLQGRTAPTHSILPLLYCSQA